MHFLRRQATTLLYLEAFQIETINWQRSCNGIRLVLMTKNDTQVRLQPRELSEFHQFIESGKSDILLGRVLKDRKCIGINVTNIPIKITKR